MYRNKPWIVSLGLISFFFFPLLFSFYFFFFFLVFLFSLSPVIFPPRFQEPDMLPGIMNGVPTVLLFATLFSCVPCLVALPTSQAVFTQYFRFFFFSLSLAPFSFFFFLVPWFTSYLQRPISPLPYLSSFFASWSSRINSHSGWWEKYLLHPSYILFNRWQEFFIYFYLELSFAYWIFISLKLKWHTLIGFNF